MSFDDLFTVKLNKTVVGGKVDDSLVEGLEDIETVDDSSVTVETQESQQVNLEIESIVSKLNEGDSGLEMNRYETAAFLQSANNDEFVLLVKDADLDRVVEAHVLNQDQVADPNQHSELIHEALILSGLDHPGIPPIYDINIASNQLVFCTLKHIEGFPLSQLCVKHDEHVDEEIIIHDTHADIVNNFIRIAEILKYAHSENVIHRNIKPDNLIIDDSGQIYVTAWGNAFDTEHDNPDFHIFRGTPLYMSPEQATCATVDARGDIYSLGACLFHVLFKRPHMMRSDFDKFLDARKVAAIDDVSEFEQHNTTAQLLAICKRCLAAVEDRYQDIDEFIVDLKAYQSLHSRVQREGSRTAYGMRHLQWLIPVMVLFLGIAWYALQFYAQRHAAWGKPIYSETFEKGHTWDKDWALVSGSYEIPPEQNRVITKDGPGFIWFYKQRLHGGAAIEFEAEMLPGSAAGDLSIVYAYDPEDKILNGNKPNNIYWLQHGAVGNVCSMIEGPRGRLDYTNQALEHGVRYKIRGEIEGKQLNLFLNGELVCTYELLFPFSSGYIGLYAYYDGKAFDNIKIYNRELPEVTNVIKMGDLLLEHKVYEPALEHYQRIARQHAGTALGLEGIYKSGLCYYHMEEVKKAFEVWKPLEQSQYFAQINFYRWKELERVSDYHTLLREMYAFYRSADEKLRVQIREQWGIFLYQVRVKGWKDLTREFLRFRNRNFPDDQIFSGETYKALHLLDIPDKALELYPDQPKYVTAALIEMGEYQKILEKPYSRSTFAWALRGTGQDQRVIDECRDLPGAYFGALIDLGLFDRAEKEFIDDEKYLKGILMAKGAYDEVIKHYPDTELSAVAAMLRDGNGQHVVDFNPNAAAWTFVGYDAITSLHLDRYSKNDRSVVTKMYEQSESVNYFQSIEAGIRFHRELLPDILSHMSGNPDVLERTLNRIWTERKQILHMRHWHNVGLLLGKLDKQAYMSQPYKRHLQSEYYFYAAIHYDLKGEKDTALNLYRAYRDLPLHKRRFNRMLTYRKFVAMRINALE